MMSVIACHARVAPSEFMDPYDQGSEAGTWYETYAEMVITADSVSATTGIGSVDDRASTGCLDYLRTAYRSLATLYPAAHASQQLVPMTMQ